MDGARPRPSPRVRLQISQAVLIDLDEREIGPGRGRPRRPRQAPIVGLELERLKGMRSDAARERREREVAPKDDRAGAKSDDNARDGFWHLHHSPATPGAGRAYDQGAGGGRL